MLRVTDGMTHDGRLVLAQAYILRQLCHDAFQNKIPSSTWAWQAAASRPSTWLRA
jgi:hypothetical protein